MLIAYVAAAASLVLGALVVRSVVGRDARTAAIEAAWEEVAEAMDGRLERLERAGTVVFRLVIEREVRAVASTNMISLATVVRTEYALGVGPQLADRSSAASLGAAALELDAEARRLFEVFPGPLSLGGAGREVTLSWPRNEDRADVLCDAIELALRLARFGVDDLRRIAEAVDGRLELDAARSRVLAGGVEVALSVELRDARLAFVAHAPARVPTRAFRLDIGTGDGAIPAKLVDPERKPNMDELGAAVVCGDGERVEVVWPGPPSDAEARAAVRFLEAAGAPRSHGGAFR